MQLLANLFLYEVFFDLIMIYVFIPIFTIHTYICMCKYTRANLPTKGDVRCQTGDELAPYVHFLYLVWLAVVASYRAYVQCSVLGLPLDFRLTTRINRCVFEELHQSRDASHVEHLPFIVIQSYLS